MQCIVNVINSEKIKIYIFCPFEISNKIILIKQN